MAIDDNYGQHIVNEPAYNPPSLPATPASITQDDYGNPNPVLTPSTTWPYAVGNEQFPHTLGKLIVSSNRYQTIFSEWLRNDLILQKAEVAQGINRGGLRIVSANQPNYFYRKPKFNTCQIPLKGPTLLKFSYRDALYKPTALHGAYKVIVSVQYIEKNDSLDDLPREVFEKLLQDFIDSEKTFLHIDPTQYLPKL